MIRVGAWHLNEGLAIPGRSEPLAEAILRQDNDVMVLSDAYWLDNPLHGAREEVLDAALDRFSDDGYALARTTYDDDHPWGGRGLVVLSRADAISRVVRLGGRNALELDLFNNGRSSLRLIGAHFSDRNEAVRSAQAAAAAEYLEGENPAAIIGDLNALHGADGRARFLGSRFVEKAAAYLPNSRPKDILERVHQMGWGSALRILEARKLSDADPLHRPTFPSRMPLLHLDRCFATKDAAARDFTVAQYDAHSYHRAIGVTLEM